MLNFIPEVVVGRGSVLSSVIAAQALGGKEVPVGSFQKQVRAMGHHSVLAVCQAAG